MVSGAGVAQRGECSLGLARALEQPAVALEQDAARAPANRVAQRTLGDGFIRNTYLGRDDTNERDETTLRGKVTLGAD